MPRKLQERLDAAEDTLRALRNGEVDAIMVSGSDGDRVYTLRGADEAYRLMVQNMEEGALTLAPDGLILFSNEKLASMLAVPLECVTGCSFQDFIMVEDAAVFSALLTSELARGAKCEVRLRAHGGVPVPVSLSVNHLELDGVDCFCIIVVDLTDQKRNEEVLRALSARLLELQDEERRRIAHGLHDGVFQRLAALEFKLNLVGRTSPKLTPAARHSLTECVDLVSECCQDLSNLAYLIQPPLLEEQGLGPSLRAYVDSFNRRLGSQVGLNIPRRLGRLPADVETTLFRIAQEALANVERHSGSATSEIIYRRGHGELRLEITDHGCGISPQFLKQLNRGATIPGIGIAGMRERVRRLGGLMEIRSGSDGTTVSVKLPMNFPPHRAQSA